MRRNSNLFSRARKATQEPAWRVRGRQRLGLQPQGKPLSGEPQE
jgi:hypothetical protein